MKILPSNKTSPRALVAIVFMAAGALTTAQAQTNLDAQVIARPLTPGDVSLYGLPSDIEVSGGLSAVGVGQPLYLEAEVNIDVPASAVTVDWALTAKPTGSLATFQSSPLGTNVPIYEPADRSVLQVAARRLLRPDMAGQYTVTATITSTAYGTTNVSATFTAATYMGVGTQDGIGCALCHSGGSIAENKVTPWSKTAHSMIFTEGIDGELGHYSESCLKCHTVGYDTNTNAVNNGFDDIAKQENWTFPTVLTNGNFAAMPAELRDLGNIQCENCHGPGYEHAAAFGDTNLIGVSYSSGVCNQCHDAPTHHVKGTEWYNSMHAVTTRDPSGPGRGSCVGCHTGKGFIARIEGDTNVDLTYNAIGCQACHEPHGQTIPSDNPHLIRTLAAVTFEDGTTVTNGGAGLLCMECHHARQNAEEYASSYHSHFGPHHGPQGDMIEGVNAYTYGQSIPSSAHRSAVGDTCVTCHMQTVGTSDPAFLHAGGHTFKPAWENGTNTVDLVGACQNCHGSSVTDFDFPLQDYDGDGVIDGVQTEVEHLLNELGMLLPPVGEAKTTVQPDATWTAPQLRAAYNYLFVQEDGSMGIHNTAYAVGVLKASIANLTGDANKDGIPDAWQIQYFGSINNPNAAPNADPAGDGVPNWLKYTLGLDPMVPGVTVPDGVVWANGGTIGGSTDTIHIYTAAEVAFDTEVGKTYQIQAASALSSGWQNVGDPIQGTGKAYSYLTPMRNGVQQYFRVVHTP